MMNVVIGAASGMGAATALLLEPVLRVDVRGDVDALCDVTKQADVDRVASAVDQLGALVITAGLSGSMAPGRTIFEVNLRGTERVLTAFEPKLRPGSVAVCFASMAAHMQLAEPEVRDVLERPSAPSFFDDLTAAGVDLDDAQLAYSLSKVGVIRMVQRRAKAWGERGARLVSVSPGIVDTSMARLEAASEPLMAELVTSSALGREGDPAELAAAVAFLVSDGASFITGTDLLVDGGVMAALTTT